MKKILLLTTAALALSGCSTTFPSGFTPSYKQFLSLDEVTANAVQVFGGHAILIANGTSKTLTGVAVRLEGVVPDQVLGAWDCAASVEIPNSVICSVSTVIEANDGLSLYTTKRITEGEVGYKVAGIFQKTQIKVR